MELLQLRYFYDSANLGSLAKTAKKYMVPPSSVSASIKRLEGELGYTLFDRSSNRIRLNANGRRLQRSLNVVFNELDRVANNVAAVPDEDREIWVLVKALRSEMTDRIITYNQENPNAKIRMVYDFDERDFQKYDVIIDTKTNFYRDFVATELCSQAIRIYAAAGDPLTRGKQNLRDLRERAFVSMSQYGNQYQLLSAACAGAGFTPNLIAQINDVACFVKFIESGLALGVAGERSIKMKHPTQMQSLDVTDFQIWQTVCVYRKREDTHGSVRRFVDFLLREEKL